MILNKKILVIILALTFISKVNAQINDTTDLMGQLEKEASLDAKNQTDYATASFKTTRLINGHTIENVGKGVLDVRISHRFGELNSGGYELFGLDNASMRMGLDYGVTKTLMVGIGRSTFEKTYDAFFKLKILRQSKGRRNMPVTLSYVPTIAVETLKHPTTAGGTKYYSSNRVSYTHQIIVGRKFSEGLSIQLMPTFIHRNLTSGLGDPNDIWAIGIGGRQKLTKRLSINAEYYYQLPDYKIPGSVNVLSIGFDVETGGHVFQLHFTNSRGMSEKTFITGTTGKWEKGDILFGFNLSRVFTIGKKH